MPDVLTMLENDHRLVEQMLEQLGETEEGPERDQLVAKLAQSLELHMQFEEQQIYPLLQRLDGEMVEEAETEHTLARDGLSKLGSLAHEPGFGAVVDMLKGGISHHVTDEEDEAFPKLRSNIDSDELAQLGARLMQEKAKAGTLADDLAMATKDQLMELAQAAKIEGRSSMTADELRSALVS